MSTDFAPIWLWFGTAMSFSVVQALHILTPLEISVNPPLRSIVSSSMLVAFNWSALRYALRSRNKLALWAYLTIHVTSMAVLARNGLLSHLLFEYATAPAYHPWLWQVAMTINIIGVIAGTRVATKAYLSFYEDAPPLDAPPTLFSDSATTSSTTTAAASATLTDTAAATPSFSAESADARVVSAPSPKLDASVGFLSERQAFAALLVLAAAVFIMGPGNAHDAHCHWNPSDAAWLRTPRLGSLTSPPFHFFSQYVRMSDGVELALDVYLPASHKDRAGPALPTILHLTRYNRNWKVRFPFSLLLGDSFNMRTMRYVDAFVSRGDSLSKNAGGYAWVTADVRGTGASFGNRPVDLSRREVQDYEELLQWTVSQPWCNGKIGSTGISYDGIAAIQLAHVDTNNHVRAIAPLFAPADLYSELVRPGGLDCQGFARDYRDGTYTGERNRPLPSRIPRPLLTRLFQSLALEGAYPVNGDTAKLAQATRQHFDNWDMVATIAPYHFSDDTMTVADGHTYSVDAFGTSQAVMESLRDKLVTVHSFTGYYDSGSIRSMSRLHNTLVGDDASNDHHHQLTIGPWTHGLRQNCSPFSRSRKPCFDLIAQLKLFFDNHLRLDTPPKASPQHRPVHYYIQGTERWAKADTWPPSNTEWDVFSFAGGVSVSSSKTAAASTRWRLVPGLRDTSDSLVQASESADPFDVFTVDPLATSGYRSRWNLLQAVLLQPVVYAHTSLSAAAKDKTRISYMLTSRLQKPLTIVGGAVVHLYLRLVGGSDAAIFVYLEDVDEQAGKIHYVTEGQLRAGHAVTGPGKDTSTTPRFFESIRAEQAFDPHAHFQRSFAGADFASLDPQQPHAIDIVMEPVAYTFPTGHRVRLSIAGADRDNFDVSRIPDLASQWHIYWGPTQHDDSAGSFLALPVTVNIQFA